MAAIPVTLDGVLYDLQNRTTQRVILIGEISLTGVGVGGGPIVPPGQPGGPVHIWGGGNEPFPTPPIVIPPNKPPEPVTPPIEWKAVWTPTEGWVVVGVPNVPHPAPSEAPKK